MSGHDDILRDVLAREAAARARFDALLPANKAAIFAALEAAGIARVVLRFDGAGDSGAMEAPEAEGADGTGRDLPAVPVACTAVDAWTAAETARELPLREAVEDLAWALLERTHAGWENNDGADGEIVLDAADRSIRLAVNLRFTDSDRHEHSF